MAQIIVDTKELEELSAAMELYPMEARKAMAASLNRTISKIITFTANEVKAEYPSIIRKEIKSISRTHRANSGNLDASIEFAGPRLQASRFPHRIARRKSRSPVTLRIKSAGKTSGDNPVMFGEGTSKRRGARGSREVYKRSAGSREVRPVYTLSIPQMISNEGVYDKISEQANEVYLERLEHELIYRFGKIYGG